MSSNLIELLYYIEIQCSRDTARCGVPTGIFLSVESAVFILNSRWLLSLLFAQSGITTVTEPWAAAKIA